MYEYKVVDIIGDFKSFRWDIIRADSLEEAKENVERLIVFHLSEYIYPIVEKIEEEK